MMPSDAAAVSPNPPRRPVSANRDWLRALEMTGRIENEPGRLFPQVIDVLADAHGERPALISDDETLSFAALAERSRRYARWALGEGLGKGDAVALMAPNRAEYLAIWLGLSRVGVITALINTNLSGEALAHALAAAKARRVIVDARLEAAFEDAPEGLWLLGQGRADRPRIDLAVEALSGAPLGVDEARAVSLRDPALLIYTSGTTGRSKAAYVSHHRVLAWTHWFAGLMDAGPDDRLYNCLPMHHSVGGVVASGAVLVGGGSVVLRPKFSASRFWDEVEAHGCTIFQYIGELCRYLLAAPPHPKERAHALRLSCGNGLRPDVWEAFQDRFAIPRVLEFYAATEGTFSLYNVEGRPGAIGRIPAFLSHRFPAAIVRHDAERQAPARDADGRCIACERGEIGEAIGKVAGAGEGGQHRFEGYTDGAETEKKLLRDVFEVGDAWMRTGDLMRQDAQGFYYFVDRVGDTFRWKGENVATLEVAEALGSFPGVTAAAVYGVAVPGADGRAGMAALTADEGLDLVALRAHLAERLPAYARPLFLRIVDELSTTETFKLRKQDLVEEGYDPTRASGRLFVEDSAAGAYVALDAAMFEAIQAGRVRL
jgi:fatty-acyl-CoA synthase